MWVMLMSINDNLNELALSARHIACVSLQLWGIMNEKGNFTNFLGSKKSGLHLYYPCDTICQPWLKFILTVVQIYEIDKLSK